MIPLVLSPWRHAALTACLARNLPATAGSQHFTVYRLEPAPHTPAAGPELVVVHTFRPEQIDNNLGFYVANELLPLLSVARGRLPEPSSADDPFVHDQQTLFEQCVGAIVRSMDGDERRAWHRFYVNSLAALERAMQSDQPAADFIGPFAVIYRRLMDLARGASLLDAGTCFGFLPLLMASRGGPPDTIVGCDLDAALVGFANAYARRAGLANVRFAVADLLGDDLARLGCFDTVTCVHVLEHLTPAQTLTALRALWQLTARRLIVTVPLEEQPDPRFGHRQTFTTERLAILGRELGGRFQTFELHGCWLVADR
ncbi:MAG: class I SAM-dependent methyltransferase [Oscillochloridaceae bacterium]|nr:class I SAM-dependent methyltransferase [Chloroflexaceae bacterium]MDW8392007.1 class I SAM-dependent methyltransferase [Oscillochloridaceae bacterium]